MKLLILITISMISLNVFSADEAGQRDTNCTASKPDLKREASLKLAATEPAEAPKNEGANSTGK